MIYLKNYQHQFMKGGSCLRRPFRKKYREQFQQTRTVLREKVKEAIASVLPITAIVLILCFTISPVPTEVLLAFLVGAVLLIIGMGLFTLGADTAMTPIGERVGVHMTKSRKLWVVVSVSFLMGVIITVSDRTAAYPVSYPAEQAADRFLCGGVYTGLLCAGRLFGHRL